MKTGNFASEPPAVLLCIGPEKWLMDQAALQKAGEKVQTLLCQPLKGIPLRDWVINQGRLIGKAVDPAAASLLIGRCGDRLQALFLAVESLAMLTGPVEKITTADVEALISPSVRETVFEILDKAAAGQPQKAIELYRRAVSCGQLTVEQLMGAMGWYYRMVWKSRSGFGGSSWASPERQSALSRMRRWPLVKLRGALDELLQADTQIKLGHPSPEFLADQLLLRLAE